MRVKSIIYCPALWFTKWLKDRYHEIVTVNKMSLQVDF